MLIVASVLMLTEVGCVGAIQPVSTPTPFSVATPIHPPLQGVSISYYPSLFISMKWGLSANEMPPVVVRRSVSDMVADGNRIDTVRFRPNFLYYISDDLHFYVLPVHYAYGNYYMPSPPNFDLLEFSPDGQLINRFHLGTTESFVYNYRVLSFVVRDGYIYLHEVVMTDGQTGKRSIRKVALAQPSKDVWQTRIEGKEFDRRGELPNDLIHIRDGNLYMTSDSGRILQFDIQNGQLEKNFFLDKDLGYAVLSPAGNFYGELRIGSLNDPYISCNPHTGECIDIPNPRAMGSSILGVNEKNNVYTETEDDNVRILKPAGHYLKEFPLPDLVIKSADEIYFGFRELAPRRIVVRRWGQGGQVGEDVQLSVPGQQIEQMAARLIQVNEEGYFVYDDSHSVLYQYDLTGELVNTRSFKDKDSQNTLYNRSEALFDFESVRTGLNMDREGRLYLTIMDPEGFKVVRLDLVLPEEEAK